MKLRYVFCAILTLLPALSGAFQPKSDKTDLRQKEFFLPELYISTYVLPLEEASRQMANGAAWDRFFAANGGNLHVYVDPRSATAVNVMGAIPLIPGDGKGNRVSIDDVNQRLGRSVTAVDSRVVADLFMNWVIANQDALGVDASQLGESRAAQVHENLWHLNIPQTVNGIPVRYARILAAVNHGNMVLLGTETWGNARVDTTPAISAYQAKELGFRYAGGSTNRDVVRKEPALEIIPYAPKEFQAGESFAGPVGSGYGHRLAWVFEFQRSPYQARWEVMVDAHSGEVIAFQDTAHYVDAKLEGGVYPLTNTEICPDNSRCGTMSTEPMPFTNIGGGLFTNSAGLFDYVGGTITTTLSGPYVTMTDNCGTISESASGGIDLGGANGDHDCDTPTSNGNTSASRSGMYELNKIFETARGYLPTNQWLQGNQGGPIVSDMNVEDLCNAFYSPGDPGAMGFFLSGGGCRNTGEIAAVFDHEWGHGMDDHDSGSSLSSSSEGYADIASMYRLWASCVGYGFFDASGNLGCGFTADGTGANNDEAQTGASHCDTDCSGVRDSDWAKHADNTPDTPLNFVCNSCGSGSGPCGRQVHCSATPVRQMAWDFVTRDLRNPPYNYDANTAFLIGDKLFYQGSGNVGSWNNCSCPSSSDGCAAANGYPNWLAADDDNGDLSDGTPHMTAIFNAYNRHGIACATPTVQDSGCAGGPATAPVITAAPSDNQATINWSAVTNAVSYNVYRSEGYAGCDFGKALVGNTAGLSFTDTEVANNREYSYVVTAVGSDDACFTTASNCAQVTPLPCAGAVSLDRPNYSCSDTITISLVDSDLQGNGTQEVEVTSDLESTPELVALNESPANSGSFTGTIQTTSGGPAADGLLSVANTNTITVTYADASFCGPAQDVDATAAADCVAPSISNVQAINVTDSSATITWTTNEAANSRVTYDVAPGPPATNQDDLATYNTSHSVPLSGLSACTDYVFSVTSFDIAANGVTEDNSGSFFEFTTTGVGFLLEDDVESGAANWSAAGSTGAAFHISTCDANSGTSAWKAGAVSCATDYPNDASTTLTTTGTFEISAGSRLRFNERYSTESGYDFCRPQISTNGGVSWTDLDAYSGTNGGWQAKEYDLTPYATANGKIRFQFSSDELVANEGWFIDDVQITYAAPCTASLAFADSGLTEDCPGGGPGDGNGVLDPGDSAVLQVTTRNLGLQGATSVSATISTATTGVTITDNSASFPDIGATGSAASEAPHFAFDVDETIPCGTFIDFSIDYSSVEGAWSDSFVVQVGQQLQTTNIRKSTNVPQTIPTGGTVTSTLNIADTNPIADVNVTMSLTHTWDGDLDITLVAPGGSPRVELTTDNGGLGHNYINTVFDDEAATPITAGAPPFTGTFRPEGNLSDLDGLAANGTWTLEIVDDYPGDGGVLSSWSIQMTTEAGYACITCGCPAIPISPGTLPHGELDLAYNQVITATGGASPYSFATTSALPAGITLNTDGTLSGTPTESGTFNFIVTATDANGCTAYQDLSLTINTPCLFCDFFDDGVTNPNWTYIKPGWSEASDVLTAVPAGKKAIAVATPIFAGCSNCNVEATLQTAGGLGNRLWLLGWYVDKKNTIELLMKEEADAWLLKEKIAGITVAKQKAPLQILPNTLYRARITFNGTQFQVFIDENLIITLNAVGAHTGTVGFQAKSTTGTFGEIIVN